MACRVVEKKKAKKAEREAFVAEALLSGRDPAQALVEHDDELQSVSKWERKKRRINNPTFNERVQGADKSAVAVHRMATALESTTVRTTLDHLFEYAEDLGLAKKVLDGCNKVIDEFNANELPDAEDDCAKVRVKEFVAVSGVVDSFYAKFQQFQIMRQKQSSESEGEVKFKDMGALMEHLQGLQSEASRISAALEADEKATQAKEVEATVHGEG